MGSILPERMGRSGQARVGEGEGGEGRKVGEKREKSRWGGGDGMGTEKGDLGGALNGWRSPWAQRMPFAFHLLPFVLCSFLYLLNLSLIQRLKQIIQLFFRLRVVY